MLIFFHAELPFRQSLVSTADEKQPMQSICQNPTFFRILQNYKQKYDTFLIFCFFVEKSLYFTDFFYNIDIEEF